MADTYLAWWTSIEVDLRRSLVINAMRDHAAMHDLIRTAFEAGLSSATPPSPSTAPEATIRDSRTVAEVDIRYEFERWMSQRGESAMYIGDGLYSRGAVCDQADAFRAGVEIGRASALASRPAEVDDESQADAKRLDWLESTNQTFCGNYSNAGFRAIGSSIWHGTLREAIDGAMTEAAPSHTTNKEG